MCIRDSPNAVGTYGEAIDETEDNDMKFLKVTSGKCEVFTAPDVNAVDKAYNGGKLTDGVCYPVQAEVGSSGGYSWVCLLYTSFRLRSAFRMGVPQRCEAGFPLCAERDQPGRRREPQCCGIGI